MYNDEDTNIRLYGERVRAIYEGRREKQQLEEEERQRKKRKVARENGDGV
jgi:hypothetical protein